MNVTPINTPLNEWEQYVHSHGLTPAEVLEAGLQYRHIDAELVGLIPSLTAYRGEWGMLVPYPNAPDYYGFRRIKMRTAFGGQMTYNPKSKFIVPGGRNRAYIPHQDPIGEGATIVFVESAIKAMVLHWSVPDVYIIGLNGCQGFSSRADGDRDRLLPDIVKLPWNRVKQVLVFFDSNYVGNPDVTAGAARLVHVLTSRFRVAAQALILPKDKDGKDWGLDDYALVHGRTALRALVEGGQREVPAFDSDLLSNLYELRRLYGLSQQTSEWVRMEDGRVFSKEEVLELTMAEFRHENEDVMKPTFPTYRAWEHRTEFRRVVYQPGDAKVVDDCYNLYDPPTLRGVQGDHQRWLDYMARLVPSSAQCSALVRVLAHLRQRPGVRGEWLVMLCSTLEGIGKSALAQLARRLVGEHNSASVSFEHLTGHNEMMMGRHLIVIDDVEEADRREKRKRGAVVRRLATDSSFVVNPKHQKLKEFDNFLTIIITSNTLDGGMEMLEQGRREFIPDLTIPYVDSGRVDRGRVRAEVEWMLGEGLPAIVWYLDNLDLQGWWPVGDPPASEAKVRAARHARVRWGTSYEIVIGNLFDEDRRGEQLEDLGWPEDKRYFTRDQLKLACLGLGSDKWCGDNNFVEWVEASTQYLGREVRFKGENGTKLGRVVGRSTFYDMMGGEHDMEKLAEEVKERGSKHHG